MSNFDFLQHEFSVLHPESLKSEANILDDPEVSAIYARKALENSVKFIYRIDEALDEKRIYEEELFALIKARDFSELLPEGFLDELHYIRKLGNRVVHTNKAVTSKESLYANQCLYRFQRWVVEVYSDYEVAGEYDALHLGHAEPEAKQAVIEQTEAQRKLEEENVRLREELERLQAAFASKPFMEKTVRRSRVVPVEGINEAETRRRLIDLELQEAGYDVARFKHGMDIEYPLILDDGANGYADYVIWDDDGTPLAVIEAKRFATGVTAGKHQAKRYAQALEARFGKEVLVFVTNGRVIEYTNGLYPFREIHSFFPKEELVRALQKKEALRTRKPSALEIDPAITDRGYQKRVIGSVTKNFEAYKMRALLVMATGTGKTRVAASVSDLLIRADWVRKVLFLADRKELVRQAKNNFSTYLNETCVNLVEEKDLDNRMQFGTYETVHNLIRKGAYNSAYFDLIVVDEAHRTIYKKYRAIFEYFDAFILGLTATPADEVHKNTYEFFQTGQEEPTDSYDLAEAIDDGYLVDFDPYEIDLGIVKRGIKYADLSDEEKEEFEEKFEEDESEIDAEEINKRVMNRDTNEKVLRYLHEHGRKIDEGNKIGKTIIFAKNQPHAEFIKKVFDRLYPHRNDEAQIIHSKISHVDSLIDNFKNPNRHPQIAISVDMLDTGIDVPEILNLVFFKPVKSKIKFWQMIGRGTRLCPDLLGEGENKDRFSIFDFCANFTYFGINPKGEPAKPTMSLQERLFLKRIALIRELDECALRDTLLVLVRAQVQALDSRAYHLKRVRHVVETLQSSGVEVITDEIHDSLKSIAEHIEDPSPFETQRFQMLILNAQEAVLKKKEAAKQVSEIERRCAVLKSQSRTVKAVREKIDVIDGVLAGRYRLETSIEGLETVRIELEHLANLMRGKPRDPVTTTFTDVVSDVRTLSSSDYIKKSGVKTELQKRLEEYLSKLHLIRELEESSLITDDDIDAIKHQIFDVERLIQDKMERNEDFEALMRTILDSSTKAVANKVLDNFIAAGEYTQKQVALMNKIKNILFEKRYATIHDSLVDVRELLFSELHPLSSELDALSDVEQEGVFGVISLINRVDEEAQPFMRYG